jgi:hypothetical protein
MTDTQKIEAIRAKIAEFQDTFPYKKAGDWDSYSDYRQGFHDALYNILDIIEVPNDNP